MMTTQISFPTRERLDKHLAVYLSIGYQRLTGRRCPNGTKHKILLRHNGLIYPIYHL